LKRSFLPLAAIASILGLLAGVYASRPAESSPPPPAPPPREAPVARPAGAGGSAEACNVPLRWRIARIDSEFGLSAADANATAERAALLWESATGRELFVRDEQAGFPIAFVFDGRQAAAQELAAQREQFELREQELLAREAVLTEQRERFTRIQADFTSRLNAFNQWASSHNAAVRQWNRDGNIPEEILRELQANDDRLRLEEAKLSAEGRTVAALGDSLNAVLNAFQDEAEEHQRRVDALERIFATGSVLAGRYLEARSPDGRLLNGLREIQVFQFDDLDHLALVLAHELGHSLGLGHADQAAAVMAEEHELAGAVANAGIHANDLELLRERCPQL
jgi:hypothetical protein